MSRTGGFIVALALSAIPAIAVGQDPMPERARTVVGRDPGFGGFVGLDVRVGEVKDVSGAFTGGEVAMLLGRRLSVGLAGYGWTAGDVRAPAGAGAAAGALRMGYGGVRIGYALRPRRVVHGTLELLLGGGGARWSDAPNGDGRDSDGFLVLEPAVGAEVNLTPFLRLALGASYRQAVGAELTGLQDRDLSGVTLRVGARAGRF